MSVRVGTGRSLRPTSEQAVQNAIAEATKPLDGAEPKLALIFASSVHPLQKVMQAARGALPARTQMIGCGTAGEIVQSGLSRNGIVVALIADDNLSVVSAFAENLSAGAEKAAASLAAPMTRKETLSIALVDALTGQGEAVVDLLRNNVGAAHQIVGGAAGDDGKLARTLVGTDSRVASDAAAMLHLSTSTPWAVGVGHGFSAATELMRVTKAKGTVLYELDGRPVFDVYKEFAQNRGIKLDEWNASSFLINNELGVYVSEQFRRARAPLALTKDHGFACAAPIPENASVAILKGDETSLLGAAKAAAIEAKDRLRGRPAAGLLVFDCICRATILGEAFPQEIATIQSIFPDVPLAGFVTYGEIGRYSGRLDGWHNASVVVVAIPTQGAP